MQIKKNKKINLIFFTFFIFLLFQGFSSAEWITKKSDISKKLLNVDDMYSNGYLNISECEKAKAKLLKIPDASGMCDNIIIEDSEIVKKKEFEPKNFKEDNSPPVIKISRSITVY